MLSGKCTNFGMFIMLIYWETSVIRLEILGKLHFENNLFLSLFLFYFKEKILNLVKLFTTLILIEW